MALTRRRWLGAAAAAALPGVLRAQVEANPADPALRFLAEWEALGWHWSGTDVEAASADWLAHALSLLGARTEIQTYRFTHTDVTHCSLRSAERHVIGLPMFDGGSTEASGVTGRMGKPGADVDIAVLEVAPDDWGNAALVAARASARHRAVVVITNAGRPGLAPLDCARAARGGLPVIEVSSTERDWLIAAARDGRQANVVAQMDTSDGLARNVVGAVAGSDTQRPPLVIWAGRSGWGPCVGERGAGLFCGFSVIQSVLHTPPARGVLFVATSGEEFGQLGLKAFVERYPDLDKHALGWLRLGANLGTRGSTVSLDGGTSDWLSRLRRELRIDAVRFTGDPEAGAALAEEGNSLTLSAPRSAFYHLPTDMLPAAVDLKQVNAMARALGRTAVALANA